jgi:proteasome lid subunit RPN8/RPN11
LSVNIVSETKREPATVRPPVNAKPHLWLPLEKTMEMRMAEDKALAAYINKHAEAKIRNHALSARNSKTEVMGLLLGEVRRWHGADYVVVRDVITSDLDATAVSVKFDSSGLEKLFEKLDGAGFDYVIVGWYHSHPGYGCFMSDTDEKTHTGAFVSPHQVAVVIDPVNFTVACFRMKAGKPAEVDFAVYWDEYDDPYGGLVRMRK